MVLSRLPASPGQYSKGTEDAPPPDLPHKTVSASGEPRPHRTVLPHKTVTPLGSLLVHRGVAPQMAAESVPERNAFPP